MSLLASFNRARRGAGLIEYGLLVGLVSVVSIGTVSTLGQKVDTTYCQAGAAIGADGDCSATATDVAQDSDGSAEPPAPSGPEKIIPEIHEFSHEPNARQFTWTVSHPELEGRLCDLQSNISGSWETHRQDMCSNNSGHYTRPLTTGTNGLRMLDASTPDWGGTQLRLVTTEGPEQMVELGTLNCAAMAGSEVNTPDLDENCNGEFEDRTAVREARYQYSATRIDNYPVEDRYENARHLCRYKGHDNVLYFRTDATSSGGRIRQLHPDFTYTLTHSGSSDTIDDLTCGEVDYH